MMKKWMKGIAVAGLIMLLTGTGLTALAGAAGGTAAGMRHVTGLGESISNLVAHEVLDRVFHWRWGIQYSGDNGYVMGFSRDDDDYDDDDYDYDDYDDDDYDDHGHRYTNGSAGSSHDVDYTGAENLPAKSEMKHVAGYEGVRRLELKVEAGTLQVVENKELTDRIEIYLKESEFGNVRHKRDDKSEVEVEFYCARGEWKQKRVDGLIEVPAGFVYDKVEVEADAGVAFLTSVRAGELELSSEASSITLTSFEAGILKAQADAGRIVGTGAVSGSLSVSSDAGDVTLTLAGKKEDFNYQLSSDLGYLKVGGEEFRISESGKTIDNKASKKAVLDSNVGVICLDFQ